MPFPNVHKSLKPICNVRQSFVWTVQSPDLNPLEHACDILQSAISARPVQPRTLQQLMDALVAEWRLISQNQIQTLITSKRMRYRAVFDAHGRHTHYWASFSQRI